MIMWLQVMTTMRWYNLNMNGSILNCLQLFLSYNSIGFLTLPGHAVSGGRGILALHAVASFASADPCGARGWVVLAQLFHTGLPGHVEPHGLLVVDVDAFSGWYVTLVACRGVHHLKRLLFRHQFQFQTSLNAVRNPKGGVSNLFDLSGQHAALYTQHSGDVDVLPAHVVHPLGEAVHCGLKKLPGELYDVEHSLNNIVWGER